ncbi:hypothetical protein HDU98_003410, partial [Podochytrium sp. JEL0797]
MEAISSLTTTDGDPLPDKSKCFQADQISSKMLHYRERQRLPDCVTEDISDRFPAGAKMGYKDACIDTEYYKIFFYHITDIALVNAWIYYKDSPLINLPNSTKTHNAFRTALVKQIMTKYCSGSSSGSSVDETATSAAGDSRQE